MVQLVPSPVLRRSNTGPHFMFSGLKIWLRLRLEEFNFRVREIIRRRIRKLVEIALTDLDLMAALRDIGSSAEFERAQLQKAADFKGRHQLYWYVLSQTANEDGALFLEFGVYKGDSINRLADIRQDVHWYGFDSFEGLPEAWTLGAKKGAFNVKGALPPVRGNVSLIKGFFEQTLPEFVAEHRGQRVAFLHVDCDLYSATKTIFKYLENLLQPGCIIVFDEYFNYPGWEEGEYKAFAECVAGTGRAFEYIAYVRTGGQVAVRLG
jgi:methyltransferase family protein